MFGKKAQKDDKIQQEHNIRTEKVETSDKPKIETWIGGNVTIVGDINFTGACSVDGSIEGNLHSDDPESTLILGETGHIIGNMTVASIYANGRIDGNVVATKKVELHPKARINGDLHYNSLEMAVGAGVNGKLLHEEMSGDVRVALLESDEVDAETDVKDK
jgi:cytoskeletal protein CcmA (bactofilin family)